MNIKIVFAIDDGVAMRADETLRRAGMARAQAVRMLFNNLSNGKLPESTMPCTTQDTGNGNVRK